MQIQDSFLKGAIGKVITIYTVASESVTGALEFFDKFVLLVEFTDKMKSLVYKSGVTRMDIEE